TAHISGQKPLDAPAAKTSSAAEAAPATKVKPEDDPTSLYLYGDPQSDRARLIAQAVLGSESLRNQAPILVKGDIKRILDLGCGDGQLTLTLSSVYPDAEIIGVDIDPTSIQTAQRNLSNATPDTHPEHIKYI